MREDAIMQEMHRVKEELAARYGNDIHAIAKALREQQAKGGRKVVSRQPKRPAGR